MGIGNGSDSRDKLFERLYAKYYRRVVWFIGQHGFPHEDARELAQVVFLRVYERMDVYRREAEWSYLATIAKRVALNEIRRREAAKRDGEHVSLEDVTEAPQLRAEPADHAGDDERAHRRKQIQEAVSGLSESLRRPLLLRLADWSYKEIERELKISEDAVKSRLKEARQRLVTLLGPEVAETTDD